MFKKDHEQFKPDLINSSAEQNNNPSLISRISSIFKTKAQKVTQIETPQRTQVELSDAQLINFWYQKNLYINSTPNFANSIQEKQLALRDVFQYIQSPALYSSETLIYSYKVILSDREYCEMILRTYPNFFSTIPSHIILDQQFIVSLATHSPEVLMMWSLSIFANFNPIQLFDPINNSLCNEWVCVEHLRDNKIVAMKTGMIRKEIKLLDVWLLNLNYIAQNNHRALLFTEIREKLQSMETSSERLFRQNQPTPNPKSVTNQPSFVAWNPPDLPEGDTHPTKDNTDKPISKLLYYTPSLVGKKFTFNHPTQGNLDIIITELTDTEIIGVIYSGSHLGRNTSIPKDTVSSCLVPGDDKTRILNTNIIQVKK